MSVINEFNFETTPRFSSPKSLFRAAEQEGLIAARSIARRLGVPLDKWESDLRWTCPECGETCERAELHGLPLGDFRMCRCQREAFGSTRDTFLELHKPEVAGVLFTEARFPRRFSDASFENFMIRHGAEEAFKLCREYADTFMVNVTQRGLVLSGGYGSGKTHLAIATAREILNRTLVAVRFTTTGELLREIKAGFNGRNDGEALEAAKGVGLLVLDDVAQEAPSDFDRNLIFELVNFRYNEALPTIFTTNCTSKEITARIGGAVYSRIREMAKGIRLTATDFRLEQKQ